MVPWEPKHDGAWHEYEIPFAINGKLKSFRLDPSTAPGDLAFAWIRLFDGTGKPVKDWDFAKIKSQE
jgi:hypothetical protein